MISDPRITRPWVPGCRPLVASIPTTATSILLETRIPAGFLWSFLVRLATSLPTIPLPTTRTGEVENGTDCDGGSACEAEKEMMLMLPLPRRGRCANVDADADLLGVHGLRMKGSTAHATIAGTVSIRTSPSCTHSTTREFTLAMGVQHGRLAIQIELNDEINRRTW
ncbi:hypothetical protein C8R43DRAFT_943089 [Mycena crocata]|nr:hypothetical protein C8R43DRAFT_943089 [Mycena crocata]